MTVEEVFPPFSIPIQMRLFRTRVRTVAVELVGLAQIDEVATFATAKRMNEHLSGRWLLGEALREWGLEVSAIEVLRTSQRAPVLSYLPGVWLNSPLPAMSVCHSSGWAYVALAEHGWSVGFDAEDAQRGIAANAFDMMAKGEELRWLRSNSDRAIELWTSKEAVQKAMQLGMHLNPRLIKIPIEERNEEISIEKSKIQLKSWSFDGVQMALAWKKGSERVYSAEDELLDATRSAMQEQEWGVGCKTVRGNV
ncbi:MAG: hypothetical protein CMA63_01015 [Euryarchaeota archaeon]|nr:hypothetical protein [Euryarchaeota archaeon]|tara:strand:- start:99817 stop:100572 length:756 start_codon:yes stop_codon:yes gene_type:complete